MPSISQSVFAHWRARGLDGLPDRLGQAGRRLLGTTYPMAQRALPSPWVIALDGLPNRRGLLLKVCPA